MGDDGRHLHWNILTLLFVYAALFWVMRPLMTFALTKWHVPGLSELNNAK